MKVFKYLNFTILFLLLSGANLFAAEISVNLQSPQSKPIKDAVVYLTASDGRKFELFVKDEVVDQINKQFVEKVKIVTKGSSVSFPNKDDIHHHVYSFSEAKQFELPLYEGTPTKSIKFDKKGLVTLGCNIHDWMKGYVVVLDTPYFAKSNKQGELSIKDIPAGEYILNVWHPEVKQEMLQTAISLKQDSQESITQTLSPKPKFKPRRAPRKRGSRY